MNLQDSNEAPSTTSGPVKLDLKEVAQRFLEGLQTHFDLLALNIASRKTVTEESYNLSVQDRGTIPDSQSRLNLDQVLVKGHEVLVGQVLGDSLNLASACLGNCHYICLQIRLRRTSNLDREAIQTQLNSDQNAFMASPLQKQFDSFEREFAITTPLEDVVTSIGLALRCIIQNEGIVSEQACDDKGELGFDFDLLPTAESEPGADSNQSSAAAQRKVFQAGDRITFTESELQDLLLLMAEFVQDMFEGVKQYGQTQRNV